MRLHVNLFTAVDFRFHAIIYPASTWGLLEKAGFLKTLLQTVGIQNKKKHNPDGPSWISEISESSERASDSKFEFAHSKLSYFKSRKHIS